MISLLERLDFFLGWRLNGWRRCNLKHLEFPLLAVHRLWEVLWSLLHIFYDGGKELYTMSLENVSEIQGRTILSDVLSMDAQL